MAKQNLNTLYISERLQTRLQPISRHPLTTVIAPMGYGKTTAVSWYLDERAREAATRIVRVSVYSDNTAIFWKSVQDAFARAGLDFLRGYACPSDDAGASLLTDDLCHNLHGEESCYIFIDDFHLLTDDRIAAFLFALTLRLPKNVHLILASRDRFLPPETILRLTGRIWQINADHLRLQEPELALYAHRCGIELTEPQMRELLYSSEGWFSAIYLNLCTLAESGTLPNRYSDIYAMFSAAMIQPLPPREREFLAILGLADEFTVEMARRVTQMADAEALLTALTDQNAFVTRLPGTQTYRFHHMMKACAERTFQTLPTDDRRACRIRYGQWYEEKGQYLHAIDAYRRGDDPDSALRVIERDAGILLASLNPTDMLEFLDRCPESTLKAHPLALLVLMRSMFNWRHLPRMHALHALLLQSVEEHPSLSARERGDLLGESDLILSFLEYNDISAMSRLHRSASAQMSRPALSIHSDGGWTFGSPSVLMMFHRENGALPAELAAMHECMPHYYKITNGHGQGAERIMAAEAAYMQARFDDAVIELERAYAQIESNGQVNMALCCDFLELRMSILTGRAPRRTLEERLDELKRLHNAAWLHIWESASAYFHALTGQIADIPPLFREHRLSEIRLLAPGRPMIEMIENQTALAQGDGARVIARCEQLLPVCAGMHYALVSLHVRIQQAGALHLLGRHQEALDRLSEALTEAAPDRMILPFVENSASIAELLEEVPCRNPESRSLLTQISQLVPEFVARSKRPQKTLPPELSVLTDRELEVALLIGERLRNPEIAERLYLSTGSVKQYVNQIYSKLGFEGEPRTKRKALLTLLQKN